MYAHDSIDLLKDSGIDFHRNESQGIDVQRFGELLISSGIVLNDEVDYSTLLAPSKFRRTCMHDLQLSDMPVVC